MKTFNPDQQLVIFVALQEYAQKHERIIQQHGTDPDVDNVIKDSQEVLKMIQSVQTAFIGNPGDVYLARHFDLRSNEHIDLDKKLDKILSNLDRIDAHLIPRYNPKGHFG